MFAIKGLVRVSFLPAPAPVSLLNIHSERLGTSLPSSKIGGKVCLQACNGIGRESQSDPMQALQTAILVAIGQDRADMSPILLWFGWTNLTLHPFAQVARWSA
jgi:hypothetical protein